MTERMTWEEIKKRYPNQVVGLVDCLPEDEIDIESAKVKYTSETTPYSTLEEKAFDGEIIMVHTDYENDRRMFI